MNELRVRLLAFEAHQVRPDFYSMHVQMIVNHYLTLINIDNDKGDIDRQMHYKRRHI